MLTFSKYLNPLFKELADVLNFSKVDYPNELYDQEYPYLINLSQKLEKKIVELNSRLDLLEKYLDQQATIIEDETGDDKKEAVGRYNKILKDINEKVRRINKELEILNSPYFGKLIFNRKANGSLPAREIISYIGKFSYTDEDTQLPLVTDWRAPIANLYYTNSGPNKNVSFESPAGEQQGDLTEKRMFEIARARINSIYDSKSGNSAADEFLLSNLKRKVGSKLQDIVSTIQDEQNRIIREEKDKFTVIQGVAGSGKTTIVLHRLAYLFFKYKEELNPKKTLVIAPNTLFLDYVSDLLPNLGIEGVQINTYIFWAKKLLNWGDKYILYNGEPDFEAKKYKGSREYLEKILESINDYEEYILENLPYKEKDEINNNYFVIKDKNPTLPIKEILELAVQKTILQKQIKAQKLGSYFNLNVIDEKVMKSINDYVKKVTSPYKAYKIINDLMDLPKDVRTYTNKILKSTAKVVYYDTEDISAALILYFMISGYTDFTMDYVIADEAQDMSYTQIYSLAMIARKNNLLLAGDLAQSIIDPVYITDWVDLIEAIMKYKDSNMKYSYHQLTKTYRTTVEIIDYVNGKIKNIFPKSYPLPEAVLRHGSEVNEIIIKKNFAELTAKDQKDIINELIEYSNKYSTIALITKDSNNAEDIYRILEKNVHLKDRLISIDKEDYSTGIFVIPITKAKGLEFDCVYIMDFEEKILTDLHLTRQFYTGCTRALHQLNVIKVEK